MKRHKILLIFLFMFVCMIDIKVPVIAQEPFSIPVFNKAGKTVHIMPNENGVYLFAIWCGNCGPSLEAISQLSQNRRPVLVVVLPARDFTVEINLAKKKVLNHGIRDPIYIAKELPAGVQAIPALSTGGDEWICGGKAVQKELINRGVMKH